MSFDPDIWRSRPEQRGRLFVSRNRATVTPCPSCKEDAHRSWIGTISCPACGDIHIAGERATFHAGEIPPKLRDDYAEDIRNLKENPWTYPPRKLLNAPK